MKQIAVVAGQQVQDFTLLPGMTTNDVRTRLNLPESYFLSQRDALPFGDNEVLYPQIREGEKIFAAPAANVAA